MQFDDSQSNLQDNTSKLSKLTYAVEDWMEYFKPNNDLYYKFVDFICRTSISKGEAAVLQELSRPQIQANVIETYIDHFVGEFGSNVPSPIVQPAAGDPKLAAQVEVVENHMRYLFDNTVHTQMHLLSDILKGGFAVGKVKPKYINDKSFEQILELDYVRDNTLAGFDPLAKQIHKGDGKYSFEVYPKSKEEVEEEYGITLETIQFNSMPSDSFSWFFSQGLGRQRQKIVMICDFYEKNYRYEMFYLISDPTHPDRQSTVSRKQYRELVAKIEENGLPIAIPKILKKQKRKLVSITNYKFIGNQILEEEETDYTFLPHIFFDCRSAMMRDGKQMTRPMVYHTMDMQKTKNVCLQNIVNEIENGRQTDVLIAKQAIPSEEEYQQAWLNPQKAQGALVYNSMSEDPNPQPLPPPQILPRSPVNTAVIEMFKIADQTIQAILGSYDAQQGQQPDMSGVAIQNGATQSNNAAKPIIMNYIASMNQVLKIMVDLFPKYITTARTLPVIDRNGNRSFTVVNDTVKNPMYKIEYDINDLQVEVKMNANFEVQRSKFIQTVTSLMKICPPINQFVATPDGIQLILDNIEVKDIALFKEKFGEFWQKQQAQQAQMQQQQMMTNPEVNKLKIAQMNASEKEKDRKVDLIKTFVNKQTDSAKDQASLAESQAKILVATTQAAATIAGAQAENMRTRLDSVIKLDEHAYNKMDRDRQHALDKHDRVVDLIKTIGDQNGLRENENQNTQEGAGEEGAPQEESEDETQNEISGEMQ
jgi:hypothetical protein